MKQITRLELFIEWDNSGYLEHEEYYNSIDELIRALKKLKKQHKEEQAEEW